MDVHFINTCIGLLTRFESHISVSKTDTHTHSGISSDTIVQVNVEMIQFDHVDIAENGLNISTITFSFQKCSTAFSTQ